MKNGFLRGAALAACLMSWGAFGQLTEADSRANPSPVPPFVPRAAYLGLFAGAGITWQARVAWEVTLVQQTTSGLIFIIGGGGGYALDPPHPGSGGGIPTTYFYEHTLQAGAGYRARYLNGFHWGFEVTLGPLFYGARFASLPADNDIVGSVEGYAQAGWKLGPVVYGLKLGVMQPTSQPVHSLSASYAGGFTFGVYAEWR